MIHAEAEMEALEYLKNVVKGPQAYTEERKMQAAQMILMHSLEMERLRLYSPFGVPQQSNENMEAVEK